MDLLGGGWPTGGADRYAPWRHILLPPAGPGRAGLPSADGRSSDAFPDSDGGPYWHDRRPGFQRVIRWGIPEDMISYRHDNGAWLNTAEDHALALATPAHSPGWTLR